MPVKITKRLKVLTVVERVKPTFFKMLNRFIKEEVLSSIRSGRSPVNKGGLSPKNTGGKLRYEKYSDSYIKKFGKGEFQGKKKNPRNLENTGRMLRSIKSKKTRNYLRVWFTDKKAKYHDKLGAGKSKIIRRMIPNPAKGEQFNAGIRRRIKNTLANAIKISKK